MLDGGDTTLVDENATYRLNSSEKLGEASYVRETNAEHTSTVELISASAPVDADTEKSGCAVDNGTKEAAEVAAKEEASGKAVAVETSVGPERHASAVRVLLALATRGVLALIAADVLVGRPLQYVASSVTARFWAVGFIVGTVFFLTAASVGYQWRRRVNIEPSKAVAGGSPREQQLVLQIPAEDHQATEAHFSLKSSHIVKQSICEDIVPLKSPDNSSQPHLVRSLNDSAVVL